MPSWERLLGPMSFERLQWLFPIAVTLHNGEEAMWMPPWDARHAAALPVHPPGAEVIRLALFALTVGAFVVTYLSARKGPQSFWAYLLFGSIVTVLVNVLVPHVPAAIAFRGYAPGVVTAVVINLPVMSWLTIRAIRDGWVTGWRAVASGVALPVLLGAAIFVFFLI